MKKESKKNDALNRIQVHVRIRNIPTWNPTKSKIASRLGSASLLKDTPTSCMNITSPNCIKVSHPEGKKSEKEFAFDSVLSPVESQDDVYSAGARSLIEKCMDGYNGCIFVYGQTASGKTYTIGSSDVSNRGLIYRAVEQITQHISASDQKCKVSPLGEKIKTEYSIKASYLEIYQETLKDLLCEGEAQAELRIRMDPNSLTGRELHVQGLTERHVVELKDYLKILEIGAHHRTTAETNMNEVSSRSHAVFTLTIEQIQWCEASQTVGNRKRSKIHFIDLAGSERADSTGATGNRLKEGSSINQSLLSLGNVISALSGNSHGHIPYRDSKLTYLLSDSLGGNSLTLMIACVTPTSSCYEESLSTLRFAERAKKVCNRARVNLDPTSVRILELEAEIIRLKKLLVNCTCKNQKLSKDEIKKKGWKWWKGCSRVHSADTVVNGHKLISYDSTETVIGN